MFPKPLIIVIAVFTIVVIGMVGYFLNNLSKNQANLTSAVTSLQTELASKNTPENIQMNSATVLDSNLNAPPTRGNTLQSVSPTVEQAPDINQIFTPNTETGTENPAINKIKADFEALFVNYQLLQHCQMTEPADYHIINSALAHEISSKNTSGRIQYDILTAAKGTYEEIYARSDCASPQVAETSKQFRNYIQQYMPVRFVIP